MKDKWIKFMMILALILMISSCKNQITEYKIHFQSNFGTQIESIEIDSLSSFILPIDPVRDGYTFNGWYLDNETFNTPFDASFISSHELTSNLILYAKWDINQYQISLETDGGQEFSSISINYQEPIVLPIPKRDEYVFEGWFLDSLFTQPLLLDKMPSENIQLYAKWVMYKSLYFDENGGDNVPLYHRPVGSIIEEPSNVTKEGHIFLGWYSDPLFTQPYVFSVMPEESITIYAKWQVKTCTLILNENGGEDLEDITQVFGSPLILPIPVREGYVFNGWYNMNSTYFNETTMPDDKEIYAMWNNIYYIIPFMNNGEVYLTYHLVYGKVMHEIEEPTREGYIFGGWYMDETYLIPYDFDQPVTSQFTLYAKWDLI